MANTRVKDLSQQATSIADDDYILLDGAVNGTRRIQKSALVADVTSGLQTNIDLSGYAQTANNLSDLENAATARTNLNVAKVGTGISDAVTWGALPYIPSVGQEDNQVPINGWLDIPKVGLEGNEVPINSMLGTGAYLDIDPTGMAAQVHEVGTFTPSLTINSSPQTLTSATGNYIRVGGLVTVWIQAGGITSSFTSGYDVNVTGLPFTPKYILGGYPVTSASVNAGTLNQGVTRIVAYTTGLYTFNVGNSSGITNPTSYSVDLVVTYITE